MKLVKTYVVQEPWETDAIGNVANEADILLSDLIEASELENLWVAVYEGNTASYTPYKADYLVTAGKRDNYVVTSSVRNNRTNRGGGGSNRSFYASVGTVIKVYQLYD